MAWRTSLFGGLAAAHRRPDLTSPARVDEDTMRALISESKRRAEEDKKLSQEELLFLPAEHVGHSVPRAVLVLGGGFLAGAVSLATMPVYAPLGLLREGTHGFTSSVEAGLKVGLGLPAVCLSRTCSDVAQSVWKTADILGEQLSGVCLGSGRASTAEAKVAILVPSIASRGDIQPVLALVLRLREEGMDARLFLQMGITIDANMSLIQGLSVKCVVSMSMRTRYEQVRAYMPSVVLYRRRSEDIGLAWILEEQLRVPAVEYEFWPHPADTFECFWNVSIAKKCLDEHLGVQTLPGLSQDYVHEQVYQHKPTLYAFSGCVAERQDHWPKATPTSGCHALGYWTFSREQQLAFTDAGNEHFGAGLLPRLESFISAGEAPVYIGWGSMNGGCTQKIANRSAEDLARVAVRALRSLGKRGIILGGIFGTGQKLDQGALGSADDGRQLQAYASKHVLFVEWAPHDVLMPLCSSVVHHGGCSTTGSSLRSGRPTVIAPLIADQFYWAKEVERKGVGVKAGDLKDLTSERLALALRQSESPKIIAKAAALGEQLRGEDGTARAVAWLKAFIDLDRNRFRDRRQKGSSHAG